MNFVLATRSSALALWQAREVARALLECDAHAAVALLELKASADVDTTTALERFGRTALFTAEVDRAVLDRRASAGVHSLKDAMTTLEPGLELVAVLARGPVEDALVTRDGRGIDDLEHGARIATGSLRRAALLRAARPDLELAPLRGNVATRLAKIGHAGIDGIVMARAALVRLELDHLPHSVLPPERFVPAVCQGIVGVVARADDKDAAQRFGALSHSETFALATAERAFLRALRGGCNVPAGGWARLCGGGIELRGTVLSPDGSRSVDAVMSGPLDAAETLGTTLAQQLLSEGAGELLALARP